MAGTALKKDKPATLLDAGMAVGLLALALLSFCFGAIATTQSQTAPVIADTTTEQAPTAPAPKAPAPYVLEDSITRCFP
jgi:hypothetical protein